MSIVPFLLTRKAAAWASSVTLQEDTHVHQIIGRGWRVVAGPHCFVLRGYLWLIGAGKRQFTKGSFADVETFQQHVRI